MTLALIALIVFLIVWLYQSGKNSELKQKHIKKSITNIPLQKEIFCKWFYQISGEMDQETPDDSKLYDFIKGYYVKHNVPPFNVAATIDERNKEEYHKKIKTEKYTSELLKTYCFYFVHFSNFTKSELLGKLNEINKFDGDFAIFLGKLNLSDYDTIENETIIRYKLFQEYWDSYEWREDDKNETFKEGIKDENYGDNHFRYWKNAPDPTTTQKIICSGNTLFFFFMGLIQGLTTRELKEQGFNYSPTWEESYRQYAEQRHETIEENKRNYP